MSLNVPSLQVVQVMDPRLDIQQQKEYVALKGCLVNSCQEFVATTKSDSNVTITCNPPNRNIAISRVVLKRFKFIVTITGTNTGGGNLLVPGYYGPRCAPILSVTQAETFTINNATITANPIQQYFKHLLWYHNRYENRSGQYSLFPSQLDPVQEYKGLGDGTRNPLGLYGDNAFEQTRGSYSGMVITAQNATSATIELTVTEPIFISPLAFGEHSNMAGAFGGVQNMSYSCVFTNLSRVMSLVQNQGAPGVRNITAVTATLDTASLLFQYLTPDPLYPIPRNMETSFFNIVSYPTQQLGTFTPGQSVTIPMQSIQVSSIPRRVYAFIRRGDDSQTPFTTDTFLSVDQVGFPVSMTWNNSQFFSQFGAQQLYNMSKKNGLQMTYSQFTSQCGSIICFDFGTDVGLMPDEAPGVLGNYQLSLTMSAKNTSASNIVNPVLYVVVVSEGAFNIVDGNCSQMIGVLSRQDVVNSQPVAGVTYQDSQDVFGGSFFSKLKSALGSIGRFVKDNKLVSKGLAMIPDPRFQLASRVASSVGLGQSGGARRGRPSKARKARGGGLDLSALTNDESEEEFKEYC